MGRVKSQQNDDSFLGLIWVIADSLRTDRESNKFKCTNCIETSQSGITAIVKNLLNLVFA